MHLRAQKLKQNQCNRPFTFPGFLLLRAANKAWYSPSSYKYKRLQEATTNSSRGGANASCRIYGPGSSLVASSRVVQPIAFITSPLGGSGEAGLPELPDGNRAGRAPKTSGANPTSSRERVRAGGPMSYGERVGAGEPRRGWAGLRAPPGADP